MALPMDIDTPSYEEDPSLSFSADEARILSLYDRAIELEFELALFRASLHDDGGAGSKSNEDDLSAVITQAQSDALRAKAATSLQRQVVEQVLVTDPMIRAVHSDQSDGEETGEKRLRHQLQQRDTISVQHAELSSARAASTRARLQTTTEQTSVEERNRALATELLALTARVHGGGKEDVGDVRLREKIEGLEGERAQARRRWRMTRGIVAGMVVGSGVDWARDEGLRALVVETED
ncbi:MAG: Amino-acid acetyltransferase, mitochondrial [Chaenotheca gracillima]|nr:MAG: Amino-acid acetyltransferase, mitochondrial [Chaenotheca gracillima]